MLFCAERRPYPCCMLSHSAGYLSCLARPQVDSHEKALARGRSEMTFLSAQLEIARELDVVEPAHRLYSLALTKNFTRGRRTNQVWCLVPL